jgi:hypothetical protein
MASSTLTIAAGQTAKSPATGDNTAAKTQPKPAAEAAPVKPAPAVAGGMMVFIDPVTKQIRQPDASEIGALTGAASGNFSAATMPAADTTVYGPGLAVGMRLDESTMSYAVVSKRGDGSLKMDCVTGDKAAGAALQGAQPAKPQSIPAKKEVLDVQ